MLKHFLVQVKKKDPEAAIGVMYSSSEQADTSTS